MSDRSTELHYPAGSQLIDGEWVPARAKAELEVIDPATREPFTTVARADRARLATGGGPTGNGWFVQPTVYDEVDPSMRIAREEIFGPVLAISSFSGTDEAIALMNDTDFGLLACIWTSDVSRQREYTQEKAVAVRLLDAQG